MKAENVVLNTGILWTGFLVNSKIGIPISDYLMTKVPNLAFFKKEQDSTTQDSFNPDLIKAGRFVAFCSVLYASILASRKVVTEHEANVLFAGFYAGMFVGAGILIPKVNAITSKALISLGASSDIEEDYNQFTKNRKKFAAESRPINVLESIKQPFIEKHGRNNYMGFYIAENLAIASTALAVSALVGTLL